MQMLEAFRALNALNEDTFSLDSDGIEKLSNFTQNDDLEDDVQIIDPEAETEEKLQDNYIGKVILDCCVCHSKLYKDPAEVELDETGELANVGEECPYCFTPDGFKVIGEVVPFASKDEEDEENEPKEPAADSEESTDAEEEEINDEDLEEGLNGNAEGGFLDTAKRPGGSTNGSGTNHNALDGKKTKKLLAKDIKPGMITNTGKVLKVIDRGNEMEISYGGIGNRGSYASDNVSKDHEYEVLDEGLANPSKQHLQESESTAELSPFDFDGKVYVYDGAGWTDDTSFEVIGKRDKIIIKSYNSSSGDTDERIVSTYDEAAEFVNDVLTGYGEAGDSWEELGWYLDESLNESIEDLSMTANDTHIEVSEEDNGKVTVSMEPAGNDKGGEMVAPISTEMEAEIMSDEPAIDTDLEGSAVEVPEEDTSIDADFEEFDEETMDGLGESYFKRVYENIESFKTTAVKTSGNSMIIEGLLKFDSGNEKSTSFVFESLDATKHGKFRFVGDNKELTEGKKAFMLTGTIKENKLMLESLNYNYKHTDEEGNTSRVYGTERIAKGE